MQLHFSRNFLGSKVGIYIGLYAITNNYCVVHARNDFYLPATLTKTLEEYVKGTKPTLRGANATVQELGDFIYLSISCFILSYVPALKWKFSVKIQEGAQRDRGDHVLMVRI